MSDARRRKGMLARLHRFDPKVIRLQEAPGLGGISAEELASVARLADECHLDPGAVLTRQGYVGRECFLVVSGSAGVYVNGVRVATAKAGDFVGEMGLLGASPRTATVRADTDMEVFLIGPQAFSALLDIGPVVRHMLGAMSARLTAAQHGG
jgi:CRP/FNR family transcriptional regulator, cyclic AMP receptor protein